jgi:hypothetical protein
VAQALDAPGATLQRSGRGSLVQDKAQKSRFALSAVSVGVLAVSAAAFFIRLADAPVLAVAFWRNALGVLVLLPVALYLREAFPRGRALLVGVASGVALGRILGFGSPRSTTRA